jgi:hypothetical protein
MTNFLDIIHRVSFSNNTRRFGDWCLSLSSGKKTPILLGPIDRASLYPLFYLITETDSSLRNVVCILKERQTMDNVQKVCYFNTPSLQTFRIYVTFQVLTVASMMFRIVFWDVLPCKIIVDRRFSGAYCLHHQG